MNYLIIFDDVTGTLNKSDFHDKIKNHLSVTDWWHFISNAYIITTSVTSTNITNSLARWFPGLLFLIIEVNFNNTSGVLPKEAFDWIGKKKNPYVRIKQTPLPNIKISPSRAGGASGSAGVLLRSLGLGPIPPKTTRLPRTIEELLSIRK